MESEINIIDIRNTSLREIAKIIQLHFPEYEVIMINDFVLLKKSPYVHVKVSLEETINGQIIGIEGTMSSIAKFLFGFLCHYVFRGSILEDVADCIKNNLK